MDRPGAGGRTAGPALQPVRRVAQVQGSDLHFWIYGERPADGSAAAGESAAADADAVAGESAAGAGAAESTAGGDLPEQRGPEAPLLVMVHGLRGTHHGLEPIVENLPGHRAVVPDLPGFGDSGPMTERAHDVPGYAALIVELIELLGGRERPVVLLGHSFGSIVAAHVVSSRPDLVRRLVLVNPISTPALRGPRVLLSRLTSLYYTVGTALPPKLGRSLLANKWVVLGASRAMLRTSDPQLRRFVHDSHLRHFSRFHSPQLLSETYAASVGGTVADYAAELRVPTLVVAGASDEIAPLEGQRALVEQLPDAELVVIPEVGHLVHYETPAAAAEAIERFLERP